MINELSEYPNNCQLGRKWCWAAVSQNVISYYATQNQIFHRTIPLSSSFSGAIGDIDGRLQIEHFKIHYDLKERNDGLNEEKGYLSFPEIKIQILNQNPIVYLVAHSGDREDHFYTIIGFSELQLKDGNLELLLISDTAPKDIGDIYLIPYTSYKEYPKELSSSNDSQYVATYYNFSSYKKSLISNSAINCTPIQLDFGYQQLAVMANMKKIIHQLYATSSYLPRLDGIEHLSIEPFANIIKFTKGVKSNSRNFLDRLKAISKFTLTYSININTEILGIIVLAKKDEDSLWQIMSIGHMNKVRRLLELNSQIPEYDLKSQLNTWFYFEDEPEYIFSETTEDTIKIPYSDPKNYSITHPHNLL